MSNLLCKIPGAGYFDACKVTKEELMESLQQAYDVASTASGPISLVGNAAAAISYAQVAAGVHNATLEHAGQVAQASCGNPDLNYIPSSYIQGVLGKDILESISNGNYQGANCSNRDQLMCVWHQQNADKSLTQDQVIQRCPDVSPSR